MGAVALVEHPQRRPEPRGVVSQVENPAGAGLIGARGYNREKASPSTGSRSHRGRRGMLWFGWELPLRRSRDADSESASPRERAGGPRQPARGTGARGPTPVRRRAGLERAVAVAGERDSGPP